MSNAYDSMDLNTAYEIAGGYKEADDEAFAKAMEMVKADDASFAEELEKIHNAELALNQKMEKEEDITAEAHDVFDNTAFIKNEFDDSALKEKFFADEEVKEAEENTEIYDINPETQERFEIEGEEKHKHFEMLFEKAKLDVWREQTGSKEFAEKTKDEKKKSLFAEIKSSFLGTIAHLRTSAQVENEVPEAANAIETDNKNFFVKQAGSMLQKMEKAFDLTKKIKVSSSAVMSACAESEAKTAQYAKKLSNFAKRVNGANKEYFSKAAVLTHQAKEFFHKKAKEAWGQRYEFIANMKDRAPKITTNLAATGILVGATVANASWLGAAVIGYGAYKATSAWVWPIITHARKEARLAKQDKNTPKVSFFSRLKAAPKAIFSNKELRKNYFKEAGWASAAGLIGLGAAGTIASVGGGALVQKSIQSLSSTAVYTANSLTNTIRTLKDKQKDIWSKGLAVVGTAVMSYVLVSCGENTGNKMLPNGGLATTDSVNVETPVTETEADEVASEAQAEPEPVSVPTDWNENMKISAQQWSNMHSYFGDKFDGMYQKISDDMLKDGGVFAGKTREEVLFEYKQLGSWNLPQHQAALAKLDSFFGDCGGQLTAEDVKSLDDVLANGGIRDVEGTECLRVTKRDIECGKAAVLHTEKVDCGCDNVATETKAPVVAETPEEKLAEGEQQVGETPSKPVQSEQTEFVTTEELQTQTVQTQETVVTEPKIDKIKGNSLNDVHVVGKAKVGDVTGLSVDSEDNILVESGNGDGGFVTTESLVETSQTAGAASVNAGAVNVGSDQQEGFVITESLVGSNETVASSVQTAQGQDGFVVTESLSQQPENGTAEFVPVSETTQEGEAVEVSDLKAVRGGYNNTGLTEKQYTKLESFFKSKGENAFEFYKEKITDDMLAKGGIFEGLTREQALFSYKQIVEWSDNKVGAFKDEIVTLDHYFNGCDETIEASKAAHIKGLVDRVNSDGTIDGVNGNRCVRTVRYTFNDCDENNIHSRVNADCGTTRSSGKKWERMFTKIWNKAPEPEPETFVTTEEYHIETEVHTETVVREPDVVKFKGNNLDVNDVKVTGPANVDDVTSLNVDTKDNILVESGSETDGFVTTESIVTTSEAETADVAANDAKSEVSSRASKRAAKRAAKEAAAYVAEARANGLSGNPDLDRWILRSRER